MNVEDQTAEVKVGTITFQVTAHFQESGRETIGSTLIRLMEREQENRAEKLD